MRIRILAVLLVFSTSAWAIGPAQDAKKTTATPQKTAESKTAAEKAGGKEPGALDKTGKAIKSGWKKFSHDVQQGAKKPACTDAQRSMNQCK